MLSTFVSEFDNQTAANMDAALERACRMLSHAIRRMIAQQIIDCVRGGSIELDELTAAGVNAIGSLGLKRGA